jgi:hypothetical protein
VKSGTIPEILGKFVGIKSQRLATNPRYKRGEVGHRLSLHAGVRSRVRVKASVAGGDCYSVLPRIRPLGSWVNKGERKGRDLDKDPDPLQRSIFAYPTYWD